MKNIIKISGLLPYFLVGILIHGYFLFPNYAIAGQSSVISVDGLALRIGSKADIIGDGFGNNGQADGGEVVLTGTDKKQQILSWESSKIRIVIGDVPTRQPITFTVRIPQDGKLVNSIPTEEKVIMSDKPLIGTHYFTNQYKYYLDQDDYFFITGNAFGPNRGTVVNLDLNKELNINEWSDGEVRVFPKQNIENLRLGANRFILRTANNHESEVFTITFERKIKPQCASWVYSEWSACSISGQQTHGRKTRTIISSSPSNCQGGEPVLTQTCTVQKPPKITSVSPSTFSSQTTEVEIIGENFANQNVFNGRLYDAENSGLHQILLWTSEKIKAIINLKDWNKQKNSSFLYIKVKCLDPESDCSNNGAIGADFVSNSFPISIDIPQCNEDRWECGAWNQCTVDGRQSRTCTKTFDCPSVNTSSPNSTQSCIASRPACTEDKWQCGQWNQCSPDGIQRRSCKKVFECSDDESEIPSTSQFCDAPIKTPPQQNQQTPPVNQGQTQGQNSDDIVGEDNIVRSTVILSCPIDHIHGFRGSGTIIDSNGSILTNKHVINGTLRFCRVGFTNNYGDDPVFSEYADVAKVSSDEDMAILKIRNSSKRYNYVDIMGSNSSRIQVRKRIYIYGYPAIGGRTLLPTDGIISGIQGNRIITNATIAGGNSGGGAYLLEGSYIGIPSATAQDVEKTGQTTSNSLAFIVSVNKIKNWIASNYNQKSATYAFNYSINKSVDVESIDYENLKSPIVTPGSISQNSLSKRLQGNIVVQVESHGEAWYVNPDNEKRYSLGRPADAFNVMRGVGLGVTHDFITRYIKGVFPNRVVGKILIDVGDHGKAYYIYPKNKRAYYLGRPADAFKVMRELGLGISNKDLDKIEAK